MSRVVTGQGLVPAVAELRPRRACVLWGRWNSAPAVTVRDPTTASGRLTRWNSWTDGQDRKSTRLNSSHGYISYAVFCLKKKTTIPVSNLGRLPNGGRVFGYLGEFGQALALEQGPPTLSGTAHMSRLVEGGIKFL